MKVNWQIKEDQKPILFSRHAEWTGFDIRHLRVVAGELVEQTQPAHEISVTLSGSIITSRQTASGKWRTSRTRGNGEVCLTPASQPFKGAWRGELECLMIMLEPLFVQQTASEQNFSGAVEFVEWYQGRDPIIQHVAMALLAEASTREPIGRMYAESLANTLILHLLKNYTVAGYRQDTAKGGLPGFKLRRAKEFINEHLEEDLTLQQVAEAVGFSQFHFNRAFRRSTGLTPQQYLTQQRINRAKELLSNGDLPLVEVGIQAGFKNQSHFTTLFRKFTALTPKAFREAKHR